MKIKTSNKLNDLFQNLSRYDYKYIDDILITSADCYTVDGDGDLIENGIQLAENARLAGKTIYKVCNKYAEAFFIGDYQDISSILRKKIKEAEEEDKQNEALEKARLSETERTKLLFLLDALKVSPEKSQQLIKIVKYKNASTTFKQALDALLNSSNLQKSINDLRKSLR